MIAMHQRLWMRRMPYLGRASIARRIAAVLILFVLLTLAGCETPPGCGPATSGIGGWQVQCSGMAALQTMRVAVYARNASVNYVDQVSAR
jgi:hypothetical protein